MLDTGAYKDFISGPLRDRLKGEGFEITNTISETICNAFSNYNNFHESINININDDHELTLPLNTRVIDDLPYDIVIGRHTIRKYNLFKYFPNDITLGRTTSNY
jgi:hypothetical protein